MPRLLTSPAVYAATKVYVPVADGLKPTVGWLSGAAVLG